MREGEWITPEGHRQSRGDDARGGLRRFAPTLTPPGASSSAMPREHRFAMLRSQILKGSKSSRYFDHFCAARSSIPQKLSEIPTLLGPIRAGAPGPLEVSSKSVGSVTFYAVSKKKEKKRKTPAVIKVVDEVASCSPY